MKSFKKLEERVGFGPTKEKSPYLFSKQMLSTTRPSLRIYALAEKVGFETTDGGGSVACFQDRCFKQLSHFSKEWCSRRDLNTQVLSNSGF